MSKHLCTNSACQIRTKFDRVKRKAISNNEGIVTPNPPDNQFPTKMYDRTKIRMNLHLVSVNNKAFTRSKKTPN